MNNGAHHMQSHPISKAPHITVEDSLSPRVSRDQGVPFEPLPPYFYFSDQAVGYLLAVVILAAFGFIGFQLVRYF